MTSRADMWPAEARDAGGGRRLLAALVCSLLCHAVVVLLARSWRSDPQPFAPLVVTMIERGRGEDDAGAGRGTTGPVAPAAPAAAAPAPVLAPERAAHAEPQKQVVAPSERRRVAARPPAAAPVPPVAPAAPRTTVPKEARALAPDEPPPSVPMAAQAMVDASAVTNAAARGDATTAAAAPSGNDATAGSASIGTGTAHAGTGSGGGRGASDGTGSDGLRAFCARCPVPEYPSRARRQGWQGTVDVALAIGADGAVADARVAQSSGFPALDDVALEVARRSRFTVPAGGNGLRGQLRYRFVLDATAARR